MDMVVFLASAPECRSMSGTTRTVGAGWLEKPPPQLQGVLGHTRGFGLSHSVSQVFFLPLCLPEPLGPWTKYFSSMINEHQGEEIFSLHHKKKALDITPDFCQCPRL